MRTRIVVAFAAIYVIWGSTYLAIAQAITSIPPLLMMGVRSLLAGGILYAWARLDGTEAPEPRAWRPAAVAGALLFLGSHGLLAWAEQRVPSGLASLVVATGTFWMIGVEWMRRGGRRPSRAVVAGAVVGLTGVGFLVAPGAHGVDPLGAGALTLSSLLWAVGSVYARDSGLPRSPRMATGMPLLAGGVMLMAGSWVTGEVHGFDPSAVDGLAIFSLLYLIVFGSVAAFTAYVWLLRHTSAVRVSTHNFVNPAIAVFLGWALASEPVTGRVLVAGAIIVGSIVLIHRARSERTDAARSGRSGRSEGGDAPVGWAGRRAVVGRADRKPEPAEAQPEVHVARGFNARPATPRAGSAAMRGQRSSPG